MAQALTSVFTAGLNAVSVAVDLVIESGALTCRTRYQCARTTQCEPTAGVRGRHGMAEKARFHEKRCRIFLQMRRTRDRDALYKTLNT